MFNIVFFLPVAVFIYSLYRVIEERNDRGGRAFNVHSLLTVGSYVIISFISGFSIGKFLAMIGVVISAFFLMIAHRYYKLGFAACLLASLYLIYWL